MTMDLRIWDVEHGACAMLFPKDASGAGRLAMIDSGCTSSWHPSIHIKYALRRTKLDHLFITNADQDHMSDLNGLWQQGIEVTTLWRNYQPPAPVLRAIKAQGGPLSDDIQRYLSIHETYTGPVPEPFDQYMGGIQARVFANPYPRFTDTNNLSMVASFTYRGFKIMFPGDLEQDGWLELLQEDAFRAELAGVTILVASHHGRESGYCAEVFNWCKPRAVIMSDKAIVHDTQHMASAYHYRVSAHHPDGVLVATTGKRRHVLTTRRDGHIDIEVLDNGDFVIRTEYAG